MSCVGTIALLYRYYADVETILKDLDYTLAEVKGNDCHLVNANNIMVGCQIAVFTDREKSGLKINFNKVVDSGVRDAILALDERASFTPAKNILVP